MRVLFRFLLLTTWIVTTCDSWAIDAITGPKSLADAGEKQAVQATPRVDRDTESKAIGLVKEHLPELEGMLKRLRTNQPRQYDRAIRDLAKSVRKLDIAKNRDEQLFEIELELLKAQNQVSLLTARLKVRDRQSDRGKLRESAARLHHAQIARIRYDIDLYRQRLERTKQQLDAATEQLETKQANSEEHLEKMYLGLLRKAGRELHK